MQALVSDCDRPSCFCTYSMKATEDPICDGTECSVFSSDVVAAGRPHRSQVVRHVRESYCRVPAGGGQGT